MDKTTNTDVAGARAAGPGRRAGALLFFLLPLLLYGATCSRWIGLPDSAIIIDEMRAPVLGSNACNHNLNNLVGFLFNQLPMANVAWKSNLVSVLYGTVAIGLFHLLLLQLRLPRLLAGLGAGVLMVSHSMWWHSTQVENYALSAVFLIACLLLAAKDADAADRGETGARRLAGLFFLAGLALFNHLQNGALSLACGAYFLANLRRFRGRLGPVFLRCAAAYLLGVLPYLAVLAADLLRSANRPETLAWAVGGGFMQLMFDYRFGPAFAKLARWIFLQFPSPFLAFIPVGIAALGVARGGRRRFALFLATVFAVNTGFFLGYETWDQFAFYLASFVCLAVAGALGAGLWAARGPSLARRAAPVLLGLGVLLPPFVYANIPRWAEREGGYWHARYGEAREHYRGRYDLVGLYADPLRHDRGTVEQYVRALLAGLPPDAELIDDVSAYYQLQHFQQGYGLRRDLRLELIRPPGMEGWGTAPDELAEAGARAANRVFVVETNGPCAAVVEAFRARGRVPVAFGLPAGRRVFELAPAPAPLPACPAGGEG